MNQNWNLYLIIFFNIFLEMFTLAVVCDDNIECADERDEALCRTGTNKYNPIVYTLHGGIAATNFKSILLLLRSIWDK